MPAILQSLSHARSAGAGLRSATGIDLHQFTPRVRSFVREVAQELRPSGIVNGFRQHSAGKSLHIQIFDGDQTEPSNDLPAQFVLEVGTLIRGSSVRLLEQHNGFTSPIASFVRAAGYPALRNPELGLAGAIPARVLDIRSVRQNSKAGESNVDAYGIGRLGKRRGRTLNAETNEPFSGLPFDRDRLDRSLDWAVQLDLNMSSALDSQFAGIEQAAAVAVRRKGNRVEAAERSEPWEAGLSPRFTRAKKALKVLSNLRRTS